MECNSVDFNYDRLHLESFTIWNLYSIVSLKY